jgi:hypothetical protein
MQWVEHERYVDSAAQRLPSGLHVVRTSQPFSPTISNTSSLTWVIAYQPTLAFDTLEELANVEYVVCSNGSGTFPPLMLTSL